MRRLILSLILAASPGVCANVEDPILGRLTLWVVPDRQIEFEAVFTEQIQPLLDRHGIVLSELEGRTTVPHAVCRLAEFERVSDIVDISDSLAADEQLQSLLLELGPRFRAPSSGEVERYADAPDVLPLRLELGPYDVPALHGDTDELGPGIRRGEWLVFNVEDNLPHPGMGYVFAQRDGSMWLGTGGIGGIEHFDGQWLRRYTRRQGLAGHVIHAMLEDRRGDLWFGSGLPNVEDGAGVTVRRNGRFISYSQADGLAGHSVFKLFEGRDGQIWMGSEHGVCRFDDELPGLPFDCLTADNGLPAQRPSGLPAPYFADIEQTPDGDMWFSSYVGLVRFDGETVTTLTSHDGLSSSAVIALHVDDQGALWCGHFGQGASRIADGRVDTYPPDGDVALSHVVDITSDDDGNLWFAGFGGGVTRFDGQRFDHYTTSDGLGSNSSISLACDAQGQVWLGTWGGGISRTDGFRMRRFSDRALGTAFSALTDVQGRVWIGHSDGISLFDGNEHRFFGIDEGVTGHAAQALLFDSRGRLWVGMEWGGVHRWDGVSDRFETLDIMPNRTGAGGAGVYHIVEDDEGSIWFGAGRGWVERRDPDTLELLPFPDRLEGSTIRSDATGVWFVGDHGLTVLSNGEFRDLPVPDGLPQSDMWGSVALLANNGDLWFGGWGGLGRVRDGVVESLSDVSGIGDTAILDIAEDSKGHIWFASWGRGVGRTDGEFFQTLTLRDGLPSDSIEELDVRGNRAWIATHSLVTYRPSDVPPSVALHSVTADRHYTADGPIELTTDQDLLTFEFSGGSLVTQKDRLIYGYRLIGHDEVWRQTRETRVEYADLPRGDYAFEVMAIDRDLNRSDVARAAIAFDWPYARYAMLAALALAAVVVAVLGVRLTNHARSLRRTNTQLDSAREKAEAANLAKSQFLANISHEIRTPMNAILGYAQLLRHENLADGQRRDVDSIQRAGSHLLRLINEVLDLSKIEAGQLQLQVEPFDLDELLASLGSMFAWRCEEKGLGFSLHWEGGPAMVQGDASKLTQVLINLLGNAVKFTDAGFVELRVVRDDDDLFRFEVHDSGIGISASDQAELFRPFQQVDTASERGGTGLGLSIVQRLVTLMGGDMHVNSRVGDGACFTFGVRLPTTTEVETGSSSTCNGNHYRVPDGTSPRVLVADDVEDNRVILQRMLQEMGFTVELAIDGGEALQRLRRESFDIAFLDIRMPVLDGRDVVRQARTDSVHPDLPVVAISASVLEHERATFREAGFDDFIGKPFELSRITDCVRTHLGIELRRVQVASERQPAADGSADVDGLAVPRDLHERLSEAARFSRVTALEDALQELETLGANEARLAAQLRDMRRRFDTDGIADLLRKVPVHG